MHRCLMLNLNLFANYDLKMSAMDGPKTIQDFNKKRIKVGVSE
jgi:hypothetical protein